MTMDEAPVHRLVARQAVPGTNSNGFAYGGIYSLWVIIYIFLLMWLVSWFCEFTYKILSSARPAAEGASKPPGLKSSWGERFANSVRLLRDGFFLLLGSIAINQSSFGITRSVLAITWTLFALFVVWSIVKLFTLSGWLDWIMWWPVAGLLIADFAIAWQASAGGF